MPTINANDQDEKAEEAVTKANTDLKDQGDIAADDAGGTAAAHRVDEALSKTPIAPD
ncbi:hypothetical protein [Caulobacter sp. 1776]|uniref:hypothetical protein n=1 Tax=Caulobacter sp. 1776 TaxID=3156420 RepID=UPI0033955D7D